MKIVKFYNQLNESSYQWNDATLLMPCISVGNVGQLAIDLLISTLIKEGKATLVGRIYSTSLRSVSGPNPYDYNQTNVMTTCEVYESREYKLVIIQQRAPPYHEQKKKFIAELTNWIKEKQFNSVVVLSSSFNQYLPPQALQKEINPIRFMSTEAFKSSNLPEFFSQLGLNELSQTVDNPDDYNAPKISDLAGSGLTKSLYSYWEKEGIKGLFLILFCSEGDNTPEAIQMLEKTNQIIKVKEPQNNSNSYNRWKIPISWSSMFGEDIPDFLY